MREILFRAKRADNGKWVEGFYVNVKRPIIADLEALPSGNWYWFDVDPETVGQFTGLMDKNKKRIFEGDVIAFSSFDWSECDELREGDVYWCDGAFWVDCTAKYGDEAVYALSWDAGRVGNVTVIGNIRDNPELLEGTKEGGCNDGDRA